MSEEDRSYRFKIVCVGNSQCGKSSVVHSYCKKEFNKDKEYVPTVLNSEQATVLVGKSIWDTGGDSPKRELCYPETECFIIFFSSCSPKSCEDVKYKWLKEIAKSTKQYRTNPLILLVGTKIDLREEESIVRNLKSRNLNPIDQAKGNDMARSVKAEMYFETSAKLQKGINEVFEYAAVFLKKKEDENERKRLKGKKKKGLFSSLQNDGDFEDALKDLLPQMEPEDT